MSFIDETATRWATPPSDKEWEEAWGKEEAVPAANTLFPWFVTSTIAFACQPYIFSPFRSLFLHHKFFYHLEA